MDKTKDIYKKLYSKSIAQSRVDYLKSMKEQGADGDTLKMLDPSSKKQNLSDGPIYKEMSKVPLMDQLKMMNDNIEERNDSIKKTNDAFESETEEDKRKRIIRNMFGTKGVS